MEPHTDFPERFSRMGKVLLQKRMSVNVEEHQIEDARTVNDYVVLKLKDINSFADGEELLGAKIFVKEEERIKLKEGSYYLDSLIGLNVICYDRSNNQPVSLGNVMAVDGLPIQYRLVVRKSDGSEFEIPFVKEFINDISIERRTITVNIIDGILEGGIDEN